MFFPLHGSLSLVRIQACARHHYQMLLVRPASMSVARSVTTRSRRDAAQHPRLQGAIAAPFAHRKGLVAMLLNRIKSLALSLATGAFVTALTAAIAVSVVGSASETRPLAVARFAIRNPIQDWPTPLIVAVAATTMLGIATAIILFLLTKNVRWTYVPKDLWSDQSGRELLMKSAATAPRIFGGRYVGGEFYASVEDRGLVVGPPGTGKTAFLINQILRATKENLSFAAVDLKPELHTIAAATLVAHGYRILRLNPASEDPTTDHWNPLDDITDETEMVELCASLLPIREARDAPFVESQRDWLKLALFHISIQPGGSIPMAFDLLSSTDDPANLLKEFARSSSSTAQRLARRLQAGLSGQKPDPLILSGYTGALRTLDFLGLPGVRAALSHSDFSMRELGNNGQPIAIFLQFEETKLQALGQVLSLVTTGLLQTLIKTAGERKPVAIFLDELGNMPPIPGLAEKLNTIRSRQMPTWMYFQSMTQISRQYGRDADAIFMAASDVQVFFRLNDLPTRELVSQAVGTTYREKHSVSSGGKAHSGRTITTSREPVAVIEPHELGKLRMGEVLTLYRGASAIGSATPYFKDFPTFKR